MGLSQETHTPGRKKQRFKADSGDRTEDSTIPGEIAREKKIKNRGRKYGSKKGGYIRKLNFTVGEKTG